MALKAVAESELQNVSQIAHSKETAISEHRRRLTKQTGWTNAQIADDLLTLVIRSDVIVHREIVWCMAVLSNHVNTVRALSSKAMAASKTGVRNEIQKSDRDVKYTNSGAGLGSVGRFSS